MGAPGFLNKSTIRLQELAYSNTLLVLLILNVSSFTSFPSKHYLGAFA
jgi:hypothetical protein